MNRKIVIVFVAVILFAVCFCCVLAGNTTISTTAVQFESSLDGVTDKINFLFVAPKKSKIQESVYVGGNPVGLSFEGEGAFIIGLSEVITAEGKRTPALSAGLQIGDKIIELDGIMISNTTNMMDVLSVCEGRELSLKYIRGTKFFDTKIKPALDIGTKTYKLGLWSKDSSSGVGTMTFVRSNGAFASLGHPVTDARTGKIVEVTNGAVYDCEIIGVDRGIRGAAGSLKGNILTEKKLGTIFENNKFGVYGLMSDVNFDDSDLIPIATSDEVKPGKATILSTVDGQRKEYQIEIVKTYKQSDMDDRSMVIKVDDKELIEQTGGIVQGMSGSPIIQNGKLVGAVTHVFVNEPTRGYGVYAEWLFKNTDKILQRNS